MVFVRQSVVSLHKTVDPFSYLYADGDVNQ
jgi:hypothetical protein